MLTDQERDSILLELNAGMKRLETYVRAMATRLLSPVEIAQIEEEINSSDEEETVAV